MEGQTERAQGYRKEAERYAELASSGQRDITSFVHKRLAERFSRLAEDLERLGSERTRPAPPIRRMETCRSARHEVCCGGSVAGGGPKAQRAPSPGRGWSFPAPRRARCDERLNRS